jgi:hypothetical protein
LHLTLKLKTSFISTQQVKLRITALIFELTSFNTTSRSTLPLLTIPGSPGWTLYNRAVDYISGCSEEYWGSLDPHLPIYAHCYKRTFVSYSTLSLSNSCFAQRLTGEDYQSDDDARALIDAATLDGTLHDIVAPVRPLIDSIQLRPVDDHEDTVGKYHESC